MTSAIFLIPTPSTVKNQILLSMIQIYHIVVFVDNTDHGQIKGKRHLLFLLIPSTHRRFNTVKQKV